MIEVVQQRCRDTKKALAMYKVYRWRGEEREYLGWFAPGRNNAFNPYRLETDTDKKAILRAVNTYLAENGYPPIKRYGSHGMTVEQIEAALGTLQPNDTDEDDE